MKKRIGLGLVSLAVITITLIGCGSKSDKENKNAETSNQPLNLMVASEVTTLDSLNMLDFPDAVTHTAVFEGLYAIGEKETVIPKSS